MLELEPIVLDRRIGAPLPDKIIDLSAKGISSLERRKGENLILRINVLLQESPTVRRLDGRFHVAQLAENHFEPNFEIVFAKARRGAFFVHVMRRSVGLRSYRRGILPSPADVATPCCAISRRTSSGSKQHTLQRLALARPSWRAALPVQREFSPAAS